MKLLRSYSAYMTLFNLKLVLLRECHSFTPEWSRLRVRDRASVCVTRCCWRCRAAEGPNFVLRKESGSLGVQRRGWGSRGAPLSRSSPARGRQPMPCVHASLGATERAWTRWGKSYSTFWCVLPAKLRGSDFNNTTISLRHKKLLLIIH